jgi:hypothetical protein
MITLADLGEAARFIGDAVGAAVVYYLAKRQPVKQVEHISTSIDTVLVKLDDLAERTTRLERSVWPSAEAPTPMEPWLKRRRLKSTPKQ